MSVDLDGRIVRAGAKGAELRGSGGINDILDCRLNRRRVSGGRSSCLGSVIERLESRHLLSVSPAAIKLIPTLPHRMVVQETEGTPFTGATIATFTADPSGTYSATINWGDKTAVDTATVVSNGSGSYSVEGSHDYTRAGNYVATVKITNQSNKTSTVFSAVKVADAPLSATPIGISAVRNVAFSGAVATFTDADPTATASPKPTEMATINWGDGISSGGTITQASAGAPFTISGKHTYGVAKTFNVTVTIRDIQGGAKTTAQTVAVVSPPAPVTTPSLIGDFKGTIKIGGIVGAFTGSQRFEIDITAQDLNGITGQILLDGTEIASGTFPAGSFGELSNGNFEYSQSDSGINVTISGHISPNGNTITSGFITGSGLPLVGSLHGTFTLTRVS